MILTNCAACAAPLAHTAPRCVRCHTRYCNKTCQHDHWRRGHKQICKKIHRGGNAEQYNANKKYKEAVAVAVEACADDTKGQTCFLPARTPVAAPVPRSVPADARTAALEAENERLRNANATLESENERLTGEVSKLRRALRHAANMIDALGGAPSGDVGVDS